MKRLENLDVWSDSRVLVGDIYRLMEPIRDFGFRDQIQRASVSIMNNIAEGFESGSDTMFVRYLKIAKGCCSEVNSMLYLCKDLKCAVIEQRIDLQSKVISIANRISKLIEYLENKQ
ncbi:MAG: four helix bundle protein [Prevotellaceae bacterium]|nr:four helix bundle protein [Prevotellaceae bacterium]